MQRKGQSLVDRGIGVMVVTIVLVAVAIPVTQGAIVTDLKKITNETIAASGSTPDPFTVSTVEDGLEPASETVWFINASDATSPAAFKLEKDTNYTVDYPTGEFNVTDLSGIQNLDSSDEYNVTYKYRPSGYVTSSTARLILEYLPLLLALGAFIAAISIV